MENDQHLYLFTLEVTPMNVGKTYNPLPSHLTLMSRFWSALPPEELAEVVGPLFRRTPPVQLIFDGAGMLGQNQDLPVHLIRRTDELKNLHLQLMSTLNTIGVTYTTPQYVGDNHKPHVTSRKGVQFEIGHKQMANAAYLIEIEMHGKNHLRFIRAKFDLKG